jgi:triosephosphate isomerase (TIM)
MRKRICAGNWKMFKTAAEAIAYVERFVDMLPSIPAHVEVVLCPPFTAIAAVRQAIDAAGERAQRIKIGAQNMYWEPKGAFTGEISAPMLLDLGVEYVILGHSERRSYFGETDRNVRLKTTAALQSGLTPIVAVGESLEIRKAGDAQGHVLMQVRSVVDGFEPTALERMVIAYEPIWAIGTGENCKPEHANAIMRAIRDCAPALSMVPILYGGSVKPENMAEYTAQSDIDGGLVGGASLDPDSFARLAMEAR